MGESIGVVDHLTTVRAIFDPLPNPVVVSDLEGIIVYANRSYTSLTRDVEDTPVGSTLAAVLPAAAASAAQDHNQLALVTSRPVETEEVIATSMGTRFLRATRFPLRDADSTTWAICCLLTDITAERQEQDSLRRSRDQLRDLTELSPGMVYQFRRRSDGNYDFPYVSGGINTMFELEPSAVQASAQPLFNRVHPDDIDTFVASVRESEEAYAPWHHEFRVVLPVGGLRWFRVSSSPQRVGNEMIWHGYGEDITDRKLSEEEVWRRANFDSLTGLANRDLAFDRLVQSVRSARRHAERVAVLFVDLDGFKGLNDSFGHAFGDEVLAEVGQRLGDCVTDADTVARIGGDEFLVVLPGLEDSDRVTEVRTSLHEALESVFDIDGARVALGGASIGVAHYPDDAIDAEGLIAIADQRMYRHKLAHTSDGPTSDAGLHGPE